MHQLALGADPKDDLAHICMYVRVYQYVSEARTVHGFKHTFSSHCSIPYMYIHHEHIQTYLEAVQVVEGRLAADDLPYNHAEGVDVRQQCIPTPPNA